MGNLTLQQVTANTAANYVQSNTADDQVDLALTEQRQIAVTTADIDLTTGSAQDTASNLYKALRSVRLEFTGAMTANRNVIVPNNKKLYLVKHSCTGGFTITVKTAAGTGVNLVNGDKKLLICDGTNVEAAL
jgi:hypothetical protein